MKKERRETHRQRVRGTIVDLIKLRVDPVHALIKARFVVPIHIGKVNFDPAQTTLA